MSVVSRCYDLSDLPLRSTSTPLRCLFAESSSTSRPAEVAISGLQVSFGASRALPRLRALLVVVGACEPPWSISHTFLTHCTVLVSVWA
jgi:hypothetical protein